MDCRVIYGATLVDSNDCPLVGSVASGPISGAGCIRYLCEIQGLTI